jgi:hypothetical protein
MNNHFGLSFTPEHLCYAYFVQGDDQPSLDRVGKISYSVPYQEDLFYSDANKTNISNLLNSVFDDVSRDSLRISVSIESNLGILKRVLFPLNLDEAGKKEHIHWDLSESVTLPLADYSYFRSPNCYTFKNFVEELVIAVPKRVLNFFRDLAGELSVELSNIIIHQLAAELLVQNALDKQLEKLVILQKISDKRVESTFLWNGTYYSSHYDQLQPDAETPLFIDLLKSKIGYIENLFEQYGEENIMVDRILLYGDDLKDEMIQKIQKNMSIPVDRINVIQNLSLSQNMQNSPLSEQDCSSYVECIGVTLDV